MRIELFWGRIRRTYLKIFRRGYIQRMAATRKGEFNQCPWDVLDPRDLKFYVNLPGYYWDAEDDPFTGRENFGFARAGLAEMIIFSSILIPALALFVYLACTSSPYWWLAAVVPFLLEAEVIWLKAQYVEQCLQCPLRSDVLWYGGGVDVGAKPAEQQC